MRKKTSALALVLGLLSSPARAADPFVPAAAQTRSSDAKTRYDGAEALASIPGPRSLAILEKLLAGDADGRVRQAAASALGRLGDASAATALIAALRDASPPARFAAVRALGALRAGAAVPALSALLGDPDPSMRRTAALELGQIGDPAAKEALKGSLADSDEGARLEAAGALARMGDVSGQAAALDGLRSTDRVSRRRAALVLAQGGGASALPPLDAALAVEKDPATRAAIGKARARLRERLGLKK